MLKNSSRSSNRQPADSMQQGDNLQTMRKVVVMLAIILALIACAEWISTVIYGDLISDSGFYLSLARHVSRGDVPYRDFQTTYTPGAYYIFALIGEQSLANPTFCKAYFFSFHALNALMVFAALRLLRHDKWLSLLLAAVFALWVMGCDGPEIILEPYQNFFLLLGFLAMLKWPDYRGALLGGIAVGAALMVKQYSMIAVPGLACMSLLPWTISNEDNPTEHSLPRSWLNLVMFLVCLGLPWLLFAMLTSQDLVENFRHVASFGGHADSYARRGLSYAFRMLTHQGPPVVQVALLIAVISGWLMLIKPSRSSIQIGGTFLIALLPLYVRVYPHYIQLAVVWGVIVIAQFSRELAKHFREESSAQYTLTLLLILPLFPVVLKTMDNARLDWRLQGINDQRQLARQVSQEVPDRSGVLILNGTWLYFLADLEPPGRKYGFIKRPEGHEAILGDANYVVLVPKLARDAGWKMSNEIAQAWLEESGWQVDKSIPWRGESVLLYSRQKVSEHNHHVPES